MKQRYKSSLTKGILILGEHLLAAVMIASLMWAIIYPVQVEDIFLQNPGKYEDTTTLASQMKMISQDIIQGIGTSRKVEAEGKENLEKVVDLVEYTQDWTISGENKSGIAYRLGDLMEWRNVYGNTVYQENASYDEEGLIHSGSPVIVCKKPDNTYYYYYYEEFSELIKSGELQFVMANRSDTGEEVTPEDILAFLENEEWAQENGSAYNFKGVQDEQGKILYINCWNYDGLKLKEEFAPIGAESILDVVNDNPNWNGKLQEVYTLLDASMQAMDNELSIYEAWKNSWQEGDTNLAYMYVDTKNGQVYTNRREFEKFSDMEKNIEKISKIGKYVVVRPKLSDYKTNLKDEDAQDWRGLVEAIGFAKDDFVFAVGVDTEYPIHDIFHAKNVAYEKYGSKIQQVGILGVVAALLFVAGLVWLTCIAGRTNRDEELHLNRFDRWKTEVAAIVVSGIWIVPILTVYNSFGGLNVTLNSYGNFSSEYVRSMDYTYVNEALTAITVGVATAVWTCAFFLIGYLSLVRRIKGGTLWNNSLLKGLLEFIKRLFTNRHLVWKLVLIFPAFLFLHWIVLSSYNPGFFSIILFVLDFAVFIYFVQAAIGKQRVREGLKRISSGEVDYKIPLHGLKGEQLMMAQHVNSIGEGLDAALEESIKSERLKTDLITNVSHDIKTPLTSIINYIGLLKKENLQDPKVQRYLQVLEEKAQRLKTLTEDVVEASKVSSGNIALEFTNINLVEMIQQTSGEFEEKLKARNLSEVLNLPDEELVIKADGRRIWRVLENIYNNAAKYAMEGSRIYADLNANESTVIFNLKNVSQYPLNISADELTERFIRGDVSRSSEGSGLGLSIAKNLTVMQGGTFDLYLDGDLFKVTITFPKVGTCSD